MENESFEQWWAKSPKNRELATRGIVPKFGTRSGPARALDHAAIYEARRAGADPDADTGDVARLRAEATQRTQAPTTWARLAEDTYGRLRAEATQRPAPAGDMPP